MALLAVIMAAKSSNAPAENLATLESFDAIGDTVARSAALFTEAGKVLTHARCVNCHPAGDRPRQGDVRRLHQPPVARGNDGFGLPAMRCPICHQAANFEPGRVPGNQVWHPPRLKWLGRARRSGKFARRSRTRRGTAAARWMRSCTISAPITWWAGPGCRAPGVSPPPGHKARLARCSMLG